MASAIRRFPLTAYFLIAYIGSWSCWALFVLSEQGAGLFSFHSPADYIAIISLGTFTGPALSALVVTAVTNGRDGVTDLVQRILRWRAGLVWYLFVFVGFPAIEALGTLAVLGPASPTTSIDGWSEFPAAVSFFLFPGLFAGPLGEEIGWRGVALPHLQERLGPLAASLVLGLLWAFWHAPLWFAGQWTTPTLSNIVTYVFWITAATFIFTWVFNNTRQSILMAILLHATMDVFPNAFLLPHLPAAGEMTELGVLAMYLGLAVGFGAFTLFLIAVTKGRLGDKG